jgi:hypothetical protein
MPQFCDGRLWPVLLLSVAACQTQAPASECDGRARLKPNAYTRHGIISKDRPFAEQVANYNQVGAAAGNRGIR